jgi:hypothetical protein
MKRFLLPIVLALFACPVFAQDVDLGLGGDASSLLNLPAPRGNTPARGAAPPAARGSNAAVVDRLVRLREMFAGANIPLSKEQEAALTTFLNAEIPAMRRSLQGRIAELQNPGMDELAPEIIRLNDQLLGKMVTAPALGPEQQAFLKKLHKDQVKSRGGFDAIKLTLEDAGAPFSSEQLAQIQPLLDQQNQTKLPPDTLAKVLKLLSPAQRAALLAK